MVLLTAGFGRPRRKSGRDQWRDGGWSLLDIRVQGQVAYGFLHDFGANCFAPRRAAQRQRTEANVVDVSRDTPAVLCDQRESARREQVGTCISSHLEPVIDVVKN